MKEYWKYRFVSDNLIMLTDMQQRIELGLLSSLTLCFGFHIFYNNSVFFFWIIFYCKLCSLLVLAGTKEKLKTKFYYINLLKLSNKLEFLLSFIILILETYTKPYAFQKLKITLWTMQKKQRHMILKKTFLLITTTWHMSFSV